jgi:hypothetical protein
VEGLGKRIYPGALDRYSHGIAAAGVDPGSSGQLACDQRWFTMPVGDD